MGGVYSLFVLLYRRAFAQREGLGLDPRERLITQATLRSHIYSVIIGAMSIVIAMLAKILERPGLCFLAGITYALMGPIQAWNGMRFQRAIIREKGTSALQTDN